MVTPFNLYEEFESAPPEAIRVVIRNEAEAILGPTGWTIGWRYLADAGDQMSVLAASVSFRGVCSAGEPTRGQPVIAMLGLNPRHRWKDPALCRCILRCHSQFSCQQVDG